MNVDTRILVIGLLFVLKFIFGYWLNLSGKPYNVILLTIHKLLSLATMVYIIVIATQVHRDAGLITREIVVVAITVLLFIISIASGGWLSTDKPPHNAISLLHMITPFLSALTTALTLYLLVWIKTPR